MQLQNKLKKTLDKMFLRIYT